jgi:hypothetical protein
MNERLPIRAGASILSAVFIIGVCGVVPAGALYWLMRPTVLPNPGVNAYRPPKPDSTLPRIVRETRDPHTLSIAVAGEGARRLDSTTVIQQRRQHTVRQYSPKTAIVAGACARSAGHILGQSGPFIRDLVSLNTFYL